MLAEEALHGTHTASKDLNEAITIAAGIPPAKHGSVEVRPVRELDLARAPTASPAAAPA